MLALYGLFGSTYSSRLIVEQNLVHILIAAVVVMSDLSGNNPTSGCACLSGDTQNELPEGQAQLIRFFKPFDRGAQGVLGGGMGVEGRGGPAQK